MATYYNGFYYEVVPITALGSNAFEGIIYDSTQTTVVYRKGFSNTNGATVTRALKDWIDINSGAVTGDIGEIEYDDLPKPVKPITMPEPVTIDPVLPVLPPSESDIPESSGDNPILETAGVFVVGVAKGTLIAAVPITAMAVAVGFMRRIVRFGVEVSS